MATDDRLSRCLMVLCFGGAAVLFAVSRQAPFETLLAKEAPAISHSTMSVAKVLQQQALSLRAIRSTLVVKLSDRRVYLYRDGKLKAKYPIAVGQPGWETPTGNFKVLQMQRRPVWRQPITGDIVATGSNNPLGDRWIGFWSNGRNQIGFHGTDSEQLVGKPVSHGCLRMRNRDIREMYEQVGQGTPVIVRK